MIELIMPVILLDEFARNRDRVVEQSRRSFASQIKRVREAIVEFGDDDSREATLHALGEIEHKIVMNGEASQQTLKRIETVKASCRAVAASQQAKNKVVERALAKLAPLHRSRNSVADGLLIETSVEAADSVADSEAEFFFVTHNTRDFSQHDGDPAPSAR